MTAATNGHAPPQGQTGEGSREPSLSRLIKLLKMTTDTNDNVSLVAIRRANAELSKFRGPRGGTVDWEELLSGHVTVIGDPFANLSPVPAAGGPAKAPPPKYTPPSAQPTPTPRPSYTPPPPPPPRPRTKPVATIVNKRAGPCIHCHNQVGIMAGWAVKMTDSSPWRIECQPCNITPGAGRTAPQQSSFSSIFASAGPAGPSGPPKPTP